MAAAGARSRKPMPMRHGTWNLAPANIPLEEEQVGQTNSRFLLSRSVCRSCILRVTVTHGTSSGCATHWLPGQRLHHCCAGRSDFSWLDAAVTQPYGQSLQQSMASTPGTDCLQQIARAGMRMACTLLQTNCLRAFVQANSGLNSLVWELLLEARALSFHSRINHVKSLAAFILRHERVYQHHLLHIAADAQRGFINCWKR